MTNDAVKTVKGADLSGLDSFSVSSLMGSSTKAPSDPFPATEVGSVAYAPLERFHEDPQNARRDFDLETLRALADSMKQVRPHTGQPRGVLEPLSVKRHPEKPGHFIINGGHRRFRAAGMAGLDEVPYVIKGELDDFDKFVLNDQRQNLSPLEVAAFINARLEDGHKAGDVARALGRPPSYVSDHRIFFDMADCLRDLYDRGLCRSMQTLALLHRAYKQHPVRIEEFCMRTLEDGLALATSRVRIFIDALKDARTSPAVPPPVTVASGGDPEGEGNAAGCEAIRQAPVEAGRETRADPAGNSGLPVDDQPAREEEPPYWVIDGESPSGGRLDQQAEQPLVDGLNPACINKVIIQVTHDGRAAHLLTDRCAGYGFAWLTYDDDGHACEVALSQVQLVAVVEDRTPGGR
ncbi:hypothetical protein GCM10011348_28470 [Marinobacterium nitratireducens]|uniref:ParB-like N-terminal domain-containing protein n=1 Tax=Marinobacterium nitratireducens TaxID=518897 RepID=A0A918DVH0_9GAMM|nr:ParB/RepB/Spo0J family partition protein [Marinobacterium nitratireducens]GGO83805.1 hypothetical protein GCM10011348_28470 [Marinobacterium nitratireducens]